MSPTRRTLRMQLNTTDRQTVAGVAQRWLDDHGARNLEVTARGNPVVPCTINFAGPRGNRNFNPLGGISTGQLTIQWVGGITQIDGELTTTAVIPMAVLWPAGAAIVCGLNGYYLWAAVIVFIIFPTWYLLLAQAHVGSFKKSLGRAINKAMMDAPGPRGFEVL